MIDKCKKLQFHSGLDKNQGRGLNVIKLLLIVTPVFLMLPSEAAKVSIPNFYESLNLDPTKDVENFFSPNTKSFFLTEKSLAQTDLQPILKHLQEKQYDQALKLAQELLQKHPDSLSALNLMATVYMHKGDLVEAQKFFQQALQKEPGNPLASGALAVMAVDKGDYKAAHTYYQQALEKNPQHLGIAFFLARLDYREGNKDALKDFSMRVMHEHPEAIEPKLMLATIYLEGNQASKANELLQAEQEKFPDNPLLLNLLGETQMRLEQSEAAVVSFQRLVKIKPQSVDAHFMLALAYSKINNKEKLGEELKQTLKLDPKHVRAKILMIRLIMMEKKHQEANKLLLELKQAYPNNPSVLAQEGWLAEQQKEPKKAVSAYKAALKLSPNSNQLINQLAMAQVNAGDEKDALETLGRWLDEHPEDLFIRLTRAKLHHFQGEKVKAVADYEIIVEKAPEDTFVLNSLGWLLRIEDPKKALDYAERAYKLAPDNPAIMDTLGMLLLDANESGRALDLIAKAAKQAPKDSAISYHLALAQSRSGQTDEAQTTLKRLLKTNNKFAEREEAQALLKRLAK